MADSPKSKRHLTIGAYGVYAMNHTIAGQAVVRSACVAGATGTPGGAVAENSKDRDLATMADGNTNLTR